MSISKKKRAMAKSENQTNPFPLNTMEVHPRTKPTHLHILIYSSALISFFYHHLKHLLHPTTPPHFFLHLALFSSDLILAFMWFTSQAFRYRPVRRIVHPENLPHVLEDKELPGLDIFICTADPYKEPPINTANTAISVLAYDYPSNKVSVYVSDDGGSQLTLFALMEAAKFAKEWLPFCKEHRVSKRCPQEFFNGDEEVSRCSCSKEELERIKMLYEEMKVRVESVMDRGHIDKDTISSDTKERKAFDKWTGDFSCQDHPTIIEVILQTDKDMDISGQCMPNLIYLSREKRPTAHHNFKAGALNVLIRVSATMTNAPILLSLDCDMISNDPETPCRALCHFLDPLEGLKLAFVQFPQRYKGINRSDIYNNEFKRGFLINATGLDGLGTANYVGTGSFIRRTALYGTPFQQELHENTSLDICNAPNHNSISSGSILEDAHRVASCNYEQDTNWGQTMGFRYGTLVEDFFTGYRMQCEGWCSTLCNPLGPAFVGDFPITLNDSLIQLKRWFVGFLEVGFSKYCPFTYGSRRRSLLVGMCYGFYCSWPFWSIPILTYGLVPQLGLLYGINLFPKVWDPWFYLYLYLFVASYMQDLIENLLYGIPLRKWWSEQRMWMIRGVTSYLFSLVEFSLKKTGISAPDFNLTSKVIDNEQQQRYDQEIFDFGVETTFFVPLFAVAMVNLVAFTWGSMKVMSGTNWDEVFVQLFISGFVVLNALPIYDAMVLRKDGGCITTRMSLVSIFLAWVLCYVAKFGLS